jgi:hypothetical protein
VPRGGQLFRALLALLLAPAFVQAVVLLGSLLTWDGPDLGLAEWAQIAARGYPMLLAFTAVVVGLPLPPLILLKKLTLVRLALWAGLTGGVVGGALMALDFASRDLRPLDFFSPTYWVLSIGYVAIVSTVIAGLFGLIAAVWRWPAAARAKSA